MTAGEPAATADGRPDASNLDGVDDPAQPALRRVHWAVFWNTVLFTAGHALTSGGFLTYFAYDLKASSTLVAVLLATPETVGLAGLLGLSVIRQVGTSKRTWLTFQLAARIVAIGIPLLAFPQFRPQGIDPVWLLIACLALSQGLAAISFVAYLSWIAGLVPSGKWGRFFAFRNIANLAVVLILPVAAGQAHQWWKNHLPPDQRLWAYVATFTAGLALLLLAMLPMLSLPAAERAEPARRPLPNGAALLAVLRDRQFRWLLAYSWWLAFWSGLTQSAFFNYRKNVLGIGLGMYYLLESAMRLTQVPVSYATGQISDRRGHKGPLVAGVLTMSLGMICWLLATPAQWWWLWGAYLLWGAWAAVNIAGPNLMLQLAPREDNAAHIALYQNMAGLCAGLAGIVGGIWLDRLLADKFLLVIAGYRCEGFQLLFAVSLIGRLTSVLWLWPIRAPSPPRPDNVLIAESDQQ